jgi:nucleotide-binding universal stress UspA family protein
MGIFEIDAGATILIAVDFSEVSRSALHTGMAIARSSDDVVRAVHVIDVLAGDTAFWDFFERTERIKQEVIEKATAELESFLADNLGSDHGVELDVRFGRPTDNIAEAAAEEGVELLVMGTTGQSKFESAVFGSTASHLVHEVSTPLLMVGREPLTQPPKTILAPVDFSECSGRALLRAAQLARSSGGEVVAFNSLRSEPVSNSPYFTALPTLDGEAVSKAIEDRFERLEALIESLGVNDVTTVADVQLTESVHRSILDEAKERGADLICLGSHGRKGLDRLLLGSTAESVLRKSPIPVLVVRR